VKVRLFRPFSAKDLLAALPSTVRKIAVLDRTKEPGGAGEPLYQDVITAIAENTMSGASVFQHPPRVVGGRYGLGSKEFTPAMVKGLFDELKKEDPRNHFSIGIVDDVGLASLDYDASFNTEPDDQVRAVFWGLGSDGTVSANKNSIKIIGEETPNYAQGYFVYDSKKAGAVTVSHLRFGARPIQSTYLIQRANFVAVHQFNFLERYDVLSVAQPGATFLLNSPYSADEVWDHLPRSVQGEILNKKLKFYVINAYDVARQTGMGVRINRYADLLFRISGAADEAIQKIMTPSKTTAIAAKQRQPELQSRRRCDREHAPGECSVENTSKFDSSGRTDASAKVRQDCDHRRPRRQPAGKRVPGRRHLSGRQRAMGKAQHRARSSRLGNRPLHTVRQVRDGLPALDNSRQGDGQGDARRRARRIQDHAGEVAGAAGSDLHDSGCG
jgi:Pyruvate/2-oxoacid:ferredoxin oxidoreductase gamma subunit